MVTASPGAATVQPLCLTGAGATDIQKAVAPYDDAKANQMLVPLVWNLPGNYQTGQYFKGGLDQTCATTTDAAVTAWCGWMRWNLPGPLGANPFPKAPHMGG